MGPWQVVAGFHYPENQMDQRQGTLVFTSAYSRNPAVAPSIVLKYKVRLTNPA